MAVPTGAEIAIFNNPNKRVQYRLIKALDYPILPGTFSVDFTTGDPLDPFYFAFSELGGPPLIDGDGLHIQQFGAAVRQWVQTRATCFPDDPTLPFEIMFHAIFPATDPFYSQVITISGVENVAGQDGEPFRVTQHGSVRTAQIGFANIGNLFRSIAGTFPDLPDGIVNDHLSHKYWARWDGGNLAVEVDDVEIYNDDGPRPCEWAAGMPMSSEALNTAQVPGFQIGDPDNTATGGRTAAGLMPNDARDAIVGVSPQDVIIVEDLTITPDTPEDWVRPLWTIDPLGGDIDSAVEGEIFEMDDMHWAKIPIAQVNGWENPGGFTLENIHDELTVKLAIAKEDDPEGVPNLFVNERWMAREILLDVQVKVDDGEDWSDEPWYRLICGVIDGEETRGDELTIHAVDRPSDRLNVFLARQFEDVPTVEGETEGEPDGTRSGLTIAGPDDIDGNPTSAITDLIRLGDAVAGGPLGPVSYLVRLLDSVMVNASTGGDQFEPAIQEIVDRCGMQWRRKYRVSGDERYGQHVIAARTISGTPGWTFRGQNSADGNSNVNTPPGIAKIAKRREGPSQMYMRNDSPSVREVTLNTEHLPILGIFPSHAMHPAGDRVWNDSFAALTGFGLSTLVTLHDEANNPIIGGVAAHRYRAENAQRRRFELESDNQVWVEPGDIVCADDARTGLTTDEALIVENRVQRYTAGGSIVTTVHLVTTDWQRAIREAS